MNQKSFFAFTAILTVTTTLLACDDRHHYGDDDYYDDYPSSPAPPSTGSSSGSSGTSGSTTVPSTTPMLVEVDTDQVMNADPGNGVGIFTEYAAGGKWHVWWTCDTSISQLPCDVTLTAKTASGAITDLDASELQQAGQTSTPTADSVSVSVTTTTELHGLKFTTDPGAILTLSATVGGLAEGPGLNKSFFFFVQDGKINGGYTGVLTNPLQFQGTKP